MFILSLEKYYFVKILNYFVYLHACFACMYVCLCTVCMHYQPERVADPLGLELEKAVSGSC